MASAQFVDNYIATPGHDYAGGIVNEFTGRGLDPGLRRPFFDKYDRACVLVSNGNWTVERGERKRVTKKYYISDLVRNGVNSPVLNATTLRKEEWNELDRVVLRAARYRLRAWTDLSAANSFGGFNAMAKMELEHETMSDVGEARVDMDGLTEGRTDSPDFQLEGLPLPITHSDFWFSSRRLAVSRNSGTPLDTAMGEMAGRRVAESVEKTLIGNNTGITYGGNATQVGGYGRTSKVYGYTNFTNRITKTNLTTPTGSNASSTLADVLAMRDQLYAAKFYGPFMLYHSNDWDQYLDNDYILTGGNVATQTLRDRLRAIEGIQDVRRLDFLFATVPQTNKYWTSSTIGTTGQTIYRGPGGEGVGTPGANANPFTLIMVQMTPDVARAVNGMDITTVQWESVGGMRLNFKVMCIQVPQLRADRYGNCGILHASTA